MPHTPPCGPEPDQPLLYEVRIKGHLGTRWNDWFDHMTVTPAADGETTLTGSIVDQAALHGVLTRIRDLGLQLILVKRIDTLDMNASEGKPTHPIDLGTSNLTAPPEQD